MGESVFICIVLKENIITLMITKIETKKRKKSPLIYEYLPLKYTFYR